jgi:hypothetical protein
MQNADDGGVSGDDAETNRSNDSSEEDHRDNERIQGNQPFDEGLLSDARHGNPYTCISELQQREPSI